MYLGSVKFFKHLILFLLVAIAAFFVVTTIVLSINNADSRKMIKDLETEKNSLENLNNALLGTEEINVDALYTIIKSKNLSLGEMLDIIYESDKNEIEKFLDKYNLTNQNNTEPVQSENPQVTESLPVEITEETTILPSSEQSAVEETTDTETALDTTADTASSDENEDLEYMSLYPEMYCEAPVNFKYLENTVYLTFDDGPSHNTEPILDYLESYKIKGTFFVIPKNDDFSIKVMKRIVDEGHSIGVHSFTHEYKKIYESVESFLEDFYLAWDLIYTATGVKTEIFRFPGGSINDYNEDVYKDIINEMTRRGFRYYDWNIDSLDSQGADWTTMYNTVLKEVQSKLRPVILMHDSEASLNAVYVIEDIIVALQKKKYAFDKINNDTTTIQFSYVH